MATRSLLVVELLTDSSDGRQLVRLECGHFLLQPHGWPRLVMHETAVCREGCSVTPYGQILRVSASGKGGDS